MNYVHTYLLGFKWNQKIVDEKKGKENDIVS